MPDTVAVAVDVNLCVAVEERLKVRVLEDEYDGEVPEPLRDADAVTYAVADTEAEAVADAEAVNDAVGVDDACSLRATPPSCSSCAACERLLAR